MEENELWEVFPLEDKDIQEVVIPQKHLVNLREVSRSHIELVGFLYGVTREESLYLLGYNVLGEGSQISCTFNQDYRNFNNEFMKRSKIVQPSLTSILYHNHPRLPTESYPEEVINILQQQINSGIYDYLCDYGVKPTVQEAIAEVSRSLSDADIDITFGRIHVLITDTIRRGDDFSHINAHKFDPDSFINVDHFKTTPLSEKSLEIHSWVGGICSTLKKVYEELTEEYLAKNKN